VGIGAGIGATAGVGTGATAATVISWSNSLTGDCLALLTLLLLELSDASTCGNLDAEAPPVLCETAGDELSEEEVEGGSSLGGEAKTAGAKEAAGTKDAAGKGAAAKERSRANEGTGAKEAAAGTGAADGSQYSAKKSL